MFKISKINLVLIFLIIFVLLSGFFAVKWAQKEIKEVKTEKGIERGVENKKADVTITTDKTEYKQGEIIKITIKNNLDKIIFGGYCFPDLGLWEVEKLEKGKWIKVSWQLPVLENGEEHCRGLLPEPPHCIKKWEPYSEIHQEWNQKICIAYNKSMLIEKGTYGLVFTYGFNTMAPDWYVKERGVGLEPIKDPKTIYSNEFAIK